MTVDWQCADCINAQQLIELQPEDPQPEQHQPEPPENTSVPPCEITEPDEDFCRSKECKSQGGV